MNFFLEQNFLSIPDKVLYKVLVSINTFFSHVCKHSDMFRVGSYFCDLLDIS